MYRPPAAISADPRLRRGGDQRDPQAAVGAEALLRPEVVDVGLADVHRQPARPAGGVHDDQRARVGPGHPADRHGDAGGGLVVGERVGVHARLRPRLRVGAGRRLDQHRVGQPGRARDDLRELRREFAKRKMQRSLADHAVCRDVPEGRGAAVAQHHLVAVGQGKEPGEAVAHPPDQRADRRLAVRGAQVGGAGRGQRGHLLGTHLGRPAGEPAVGGLEAGREDDRVGHASHLIRHAPVPPADPLPPVIRVPLA